MRISFLPFLLVTCLGLGWSAPEAPAQSSNHSQLFFDSSGTDQAGFGANEIITISGNITYYGRRDPRPEGANAGSPVQDFVQPASDVYIVRHGYYHGMGGPNLNLFLSDVAGAPNTVLGTGGGGFVEQQIASTAPQGLLMSGDYDVVVDEHQNGYFEPDFDLYLGGRGQVPAITVAVPVGVPTLPNPGITAMKAAGNAEFKAASQLNAAFRVIEIAYDKIAGDGMDSKVKDVFTAIVKEFRNEPDDDAPFKLGFTAARNALANKMKQGLGLVADPPDPDFSQVVALGQTAGAWETDAEPLFAAAGAFANAIDREALLEAALLASLEKYQGAAAAQNGRWALAHARGVAHFAGLLAGEISRNQPVWGAMKAATIGSVLDFDALLNQNRLLQARLRSSGFTALEKQYLADLGISGPEIVVALNRFLAQPQTGSKAEWLTALDAKMAAGVAGSAGYNQLAVEMNAVIAALLAETSIDRDDPTVSIGGPFSGPAGSALAFSVVAADAHGREMAFEWDLDGDGDFDDATGATPSVTMPSAGTGFAGVRVTNDGGRSSFAYAPLKVTASNLPPALTAATPPEAAVELEVGANKLFSITAADPEGGATSLGWTLDGVEVGTAVDYLFTPDAAHQGVRELSVTATDPTGLRRTRVWLVTVTKPSPLADLALSLEAPAAPVQSGAEFTWVMTVENHGPVAAANVVVTQALPAGLAFVRASASFGTASQSDGKVTVNLGTVAAGGIATVWVQTTTTAAGSYQTSAGVSSGTTDFEAANNTSTASVRVNAPSPLSADLNLSASVLPSTVVLGGTQMITFTTANAGPDQAAALVLETQLPENVTFLTSSPTALSSDDGLVRITLPDLANGANTVATITVRPTQAGSGLAYAQVFGAQNEASFANNETSILLSAIALPPAVSDLTVTQTAPASARIGLPATWTVTVTNNGPDDAVNVTLLDRLPAGARFVAAKPAPASLGSGQASFLLGTLASGASRTVSLTVEPQFAGEAVNLATVSSDSRDANGATATSSIAVLAAPTTTANLSAVLSASASSAPLNANITFTLILSNAGPDAASDVTASTTLPAGMVFVSGTGGASQADGVVTVTAASLASGGSAVFEITGTVQAAHPLVAVSSVASADHDPEEANNHTSIRVLGTDPAASVAIIRNLDDPEIPKLQEYLSELGMSAQIFDDEGLTITVLAPYRLIIWNDLSYAAFGIRAPLIDIFQAVADSGRPLFFIGDDLAFVTNYAGIPEPQATNWTNLMHLQPTSFNIGNGGQTIVSLAHPVTNGISGAVGDSTYNWDPDNTTATGLPGEVILARSSGADSLVAFRDPVTRRKSVTQNELLFTQVPTMAGREERRKLFKNAVVWLLSDDQPVDLMVTQSAPVSVVIGSPAIIRLVVTNKGPGMANAVTLQDTLPAGLSYGTATTGRGTVTHVGGVITAMLGSLAPGESVTLEFVLNAESPGALIHQVNVSAVEDESAPADNAAVIPLAIVAAGAVTLKAAYQFEDTLAACEPDAPPLMAIDPPNADGFTTTDVNGRTRRVYLWNGNRAAGETAGLTLPAGGLLPAENYSVEMLFRFTEEAGGVRRLVDASNRTNPSGLSLDAQNQLQVGTATAGTNMAAPLLFHHVVLTVAPGGNVTTYLDGIRQSVLTGVNDLNLTASGLLHFFTANTSGAGSSDFADGEIALLRVYEGVLPANRVAAQAAFPFGPDRTMNANADLTTVLNPIGVWTCGFSTTRGTPFLPSVQVMAVDSRWFFWGATSNGPWVYRSRQEQTIASGTIRQPPDLLGMDPSYDGRNAVLRWTAPAGGVYRVQGRFQGIDVSPNGTDVALLKNGDLALTLFSDYVNGFELRKPFDLTVSLAMGETVDFSLGIGGNSNLYDSTGLDAVVTALAVTDDCCSGTDLAVTQTFSPSIVAPGELTTCTLKVTNAGLRPASGVILTDIIPVGITLMGSAAGGGEVQQSGEVLTIALGGLAFGETREVSLLLSGHAAGAYSNVVQVSGGTFDPAPANNVSTASFTVGGGIPLAASVRTTVEVVNAGDEFSFELVLANSGTQPAANAMLSATLPAGTTFVSATGGAVPLDGVVHFPPRALVAGGAAGYSVRLRADVPGTATLTAEASGPVGSVLRGTTASGSVNVLGVPPLPELHLAITTDPAQPLAGCRVTYTFTVTNNSPTLAFGVQLASPIPSGLVLVSTGASQGTASVSGNTLTAALGSIAQGNPATVTLTALATAAETTIVGASVTGGVTPPTLRHRWSFGEAVGAASSGAMLTDSIGGSHGFIRGAGAQSTGSGILLPGGAPEAAAYVDLPNGLISPLTQVTFEGWVTVNATTARWGHFFSFGSSSPGGADGEISGPGNTNGGSEEGLDYIALTSSRETDHNLQRFAVRNYEDGPAGAFYHDSASVTVIGQPIHFVVTVDNSTSGQMALRYYRDGVLMGELHNIPFNLSDLRDVNNWLGRGNFTNYPHVAATFEEFRLHSRVLSAAEVEASRISGSEVLPGTVSPDAVVTTATAFIRRDIAIPPAGTPCAIPLALAIFPAPEQQSYRLEWTATPGRKYLMQSSADLLRWVNVPSALSATLPLESWIDPGPPATERAPSAEPERFYRIFEIVP
ncbi:MAG: hypothetical protein V4675_10120 [Verrucomicrobiota bacterium]